MKPRRYNVSALRADIYRVFDRALETGVAIEVERNGRVLRIVPEATTTNALAAGAARVFAGRSGVDRALRLVGGVEA